MESDGHYSMKIGDEAPDFSLEGVDGKKYSLSSFRNPLVIFFTCNHCPYANAVEPRLMGLVTEFSEVSFVGINSNDATQYPDDSFENMKERALAKSYNFVYLHDVTQNVAKVYGAQCTPHFFLFSNRKLVYQGRFDDNWQDAQSVKEQNLRDAIVAVLAGKDVPKEITPAMGCSIKWKL